MTKRVLVIVEGQTEERFVKQVLQPNFESRNVYLQPIVLASKREISGGKFRGGVSSFAQFNRDARRIIDKPGGAIITTMLDYYRLPQDFPGMATRPAGTPQVRVAHVESAIHDYFHRPGHFVPYLSLHEFEALLFCSTDELSRVLTLDAKGAQFLAGIRASFRTPEDINEHPGNNPSKRIEAVAVGYRKVLHGPTVCARVGLKQLRLECRHFDA